MWAEDNEFFKFYNELQKSAIYFSSLAFRQMMPRGRRAGGEEDPLQNYYQATEDTASISSAKVSKKALQAPKPKPLVPVISISDYQNVGVGLKKRVNFAHPLLAKSPTPVMMQMWEGGGSGEGDVVLEDGIITHELYGDESFPNDPSIVAESLAQYLSVGVCGDEDESQGQSGQQDAITIKRRKRRSRKKRNKDNHMELDEQHQFSERDYSYYDENDPFAAFAAPLNEEDYEFISDVRRCGDKSEESQPAIKVCDEDGLSQMKQLYGDGGAQRILQMEEVIEANFLEESKRIIG